eukprot:CAMPEP_0172359552 /NCGR_PEP_ID=MMETSP1060-20121228/3730_1 /TAXON_ID=37318 /ORGANISM="Pseudo-nitzschia pungens, Strain cf. cingulata" /LENGTH=555 /DNA_ID=CAMNT_0013081241 /DNA_START=473 /DNA_END=2140 /DNA_ORIENTATION=+
MSNKELYSEVLVSFGSALSKFVETADYKFEIRKARKERDPVLRELRRDLTERRQACIENNVHSARYYLELTTRAEKKKFSQLACALAEAEDRLTAELFRRTVDAEWDRIEKLVDEELRRVSRTGHPHLVNNCCGCGIGLTSNLRFVKQHGIFPFEHIHTMSCCGAKLCPPCYEAVFVLDPDKKKNKKKNRNNKNKNDDDDAIETETAARRTRLPTLPEPGTESKQNKNKNAVCPKCKHTPTNPNEITLEDKLRFAMIGMPWAMGVMMDLYLSGEGGIPPDENKAKFWLHKAAHAHHPLAQFMLSREYERSGMLPLASKFLILSADQGNAMAHFQLADMHSRGGIVPKDPKKVLRYASLAAYQQMDSIGGREYHLLGLHYLSQNKTVHNAILALYWFGKAAEIHPRIHNPVFVERLFMTFYQAHTGLSILPFVRNVDRNYIAYCKSFGVHFTDQRCSVCGKSAVSNNNISNNNINGESKGETEGESKTSAEPAAWPCCAGCNVFRYCSVACQKADWNGGHKLVCKGRHWLEEELPGLQLQGKGRKQLVRSTMKAFN